MKKLLLKFEVMAMLVVGSFAASAQFITNNGMTLSNSSVLSTNGDWTNASGSALINQGVIITDQSFVNDGTLDASSTGGFQLNFASDLSFKPGGPKLGYLVKSGIGAMQLTGTLHLKDSLLLSGGTIKVMNATDTVWLLGVRLVTGNNTFIDGKFARSGQGDLVFPLGRDGFALPLKLYKSNFSKATASVVPAPAGYTAGAGVEALINFPYAWRVDKKAATDTAAYVEVTYPDNLPTATNAIIVRATTANRFAGMGARAVVNSGGKALVRSYSRGLKGLFSVAKGFPVDPVTDSLALVALYDATGGASWTTKTNWKTGLIDTWFGVTRAGQTITALNLPNNNLDGQVPDQLTDILGLQVVNLSKNKITTLPNFTANTSLTGFNVSENRLTFASLEPNASISVMNYSAQAQLGTPLDLQLEVHSPYSLTIDAGGNQTTYQWKRNGTNQANATAKTLTIADLTRDNMGTYVLEAKHPQLPNLTLTSVPQRILAYADISGRFMENSTSGIDKAHMKLLRIADTGFDTTRTMDITGDGTYKFEKVILDDYQIVAFADTNRYDRALPTYYKDKFLWEEADTVFHRDHVTGLNIASQFEPAPPTGGRGVIAGTLFEPEEDGRTKKNKRVGGAGVSARRVENTGRGKEVRYILVAYVFTNDDGEFSISNLPEDNYVLNIQYPGYPMDETSFVSFTIGKALETEIRVTALVSEGKIKVERIKITEVWEKSNYRANVYPNPAVDFIQLEFPEVSAQRKVTLYDLSGKIVREQSAVEAESVLDVGSLGQGFYLLNISESDRVVKTVKVTIK